MFLKTFLTVLAYVIIEELLFTGSASVSVDCQSKPQSDYLFCDSTKNAEERASDLVSRLTQSELIDQTSSIAPAISRLGIKDYNWRSNCVHGWSASGGHWPEDLKWTVFPAPIGLAATFNTKLVRSVGSVTADEGRGLHNVMLDRFNGSSTEAAGLNCFSPNVNLFRDPRWGRGQETFGEDPFLLSVLTTAYTNGLQIGEDVNYIKIGACAKHYTVHSGPDQSRADFVAETSLHDLYDTYLPAFKSQVLAANVTQIMPAYSGVKCSGSADGAPDAANPFLLKTVLREQFGASNISVVSDNGGVAEVYATHHFASSAKEGAALCMNATTDLDLGHDRIYPIYLPQAVSDGLVSIDTIKESVWRSFLLRIRLGDFDPPTKVPYQQIDSSHINTADNKKLNVQAAKESIVLLKNTKSSLPLVAKSMKKIAIIGPNANDDRVLLSNYEGNPDAVVNVQEGIINKLNGTGVNVTTSKGCKSIDCPDKTGFMDAISAAKGADYVLMVLGLQGSLEGEGHDRKQTKCEGTEVDVLGLPGCQGELVSSIVEENPKVILILINGGPLSIPDELNNPGVLAILEAFYTGALGGTAIASVLLGEYNPAGRMPITTVMSSKELADATDYNMSKPPGRTYRYYKNKPLIPFGFGLSYTTFDYSVSIMSSTSLKPCESLVVSALVKNTGQIEGDEVIQVYISPTELQQFSEPYQPRIQLVGFARVSLKPSTSFSQFFTINPYLLSLVNEEGINVIFPGVYTVNIGGCLPVNSTYGGECKSTTQQFTISGSSPVQVNSCAEAPQCLSC